jgi:cbb3-type cytochrome oxidase maturation protein
MFLQFWILFMLVGLTVTMWIFIWAVKHGQFDDQDRARYLPLLSEPMPVIAVQKIRWSKEMTVVVIVLLLGLSSIIRMLYIVLSN